MIAADAIQRWFSDHPEITVERTSEAGWLAVLPGERKRAIPTHLRLGERTLAVESFFIHAPEENQAQTYALLLRRHLASHIYRFALTGDGDVLIVGVFPAAAVTLEQVDVLLGQLIALVDETFDAALRLGFAHYIDREQAWRAKVGAAPNPIT